MTRGARARARLALVTGAVVLTLVGGVHLDTASAAAAPAHETGPGTASSTGPTAASVDETRPHDHVVDPSTGGLISVAGAVGVVADAAGLGPVHADPVPTGASISAPVDTDSLLERAALEQPADSEAPVPVGDTAPVGTPGIRTLSQHVQPSCTGTGTDGHRVQVLYVHEAGTPSRYAAVLPVIRNEVANVDDVFALSAQQTGGTRRVRWVHDASCLPVVADVTVPAGSLGSDFWATVKALKAQGYASASRKYLMFADAKSLCGIGTVMSDSRPVGNANDGATASYSRVDAPCWSTGHSVAAHELTHNLGGVLSGAPHATRNGHCYDESDLMCYDDGSGVKMQQVCASAQEQLLDCHHDDYFNTAPAAGSYLATSWNTARSSFLDDVVVPGGSSGSVVPVDPTTPAAIWTGARRVGRDGLEATLLDASAERLAERPVTLQVRWRGTSTWRDLRSLTTDARGRVTAAPALTDAGWFRFAFPGDQGHLAARTAPVYLKMPTRVRMTTSSPHRLVGTLVTDGGTTVADVPLLLQRRVEGSSRWTTVARLRTGADGAVARRVRPARVTRFRWVQPGTATWLAAVSGSRTVR